MSTAVRGIFHGREGVKRAVERLAEKSVPADTITVWVLDDDGKPKRQVAVEDEAGTLRGALIGAAVGGAVGLAIAVLGLAGAFGAVGVERLGLGSLAGILRAIATGAAAGVPLGALLGLGHWRGRKTLSEDELDGGAAMVVVESDELAETARRVLEEAGAERVTG